MNEDRTPDPRSGEWPDHQEPTPAPSRLLWPFKRLWWGLEKHLLWPVSDSFRRMTGAMRYRSPLAYIGATVMVCLTAGAVATAVYFYNEARQPDPAPVVAEAPLGSDTVVAPVAPVAPPPTAKAPSNSGSKDDGSLQGVVPDFNASAGTDTNAGSGGDAKGGSSGKDDSQKLPKTVVRPSKPPDSPPLKVAHRFAETFVGYEVGEKKSAGKLRKTSTARLAGELTARPPRLPSNGQVPKASVLNVVAGKKKGRRMEASVSLMRSGATSELRLELTRIDGKRWLVSEVKG